MSMRATKPDEYVALTQLGGAEGDSGESDAVHISATLEPKVCDEISEFASDRLLRPQNGRNATGQRNLVS
jgi:hypothetical protein